MIRYIFIFFFSLFSVSSFADVVDAKYLVPMPDDIVLGDPEAKNVIIEYSSLSCPLCAHFHDVVLPVIDQKYLQTKKAKLIFRNFAIRASDLKAGAVMLCVPKKDQRMFLDVLFKTQRNWAIETSKHAETLEHLARLGGIDGGKARECLEDKKIEERIIAIREFAQKRISVGSAPTFIINGKKISSLIGLDTIEQELSF